MPIWNRTRFRFFDICPGDRQFQSVLLLSFAFMLIFTAFQTMGNIEKVVLDSIQVGDGYVSLAIIYTVFAASNWMAPSIVAILGVKRSMIAGSVLYAMFIASFLYPLAWLLYVMSGILGVGAAVIWTAQGSYLTIASTKETMSRNSGIFWAILQCSMFLGNSFVFWQFEGKVKIDVQTRTLVFSVLTAVAITGVLALFFLRTPQPQLDLPNDLEFSDPDARSPLLAFKKSLTLFTKREMMLLFWTFLYTGIELCFFSGVYSAAVGFTNLLGTEAKRLVGLCGILVGAGEVMGGFTFGLLGSRTVKKGRDPIIFLGFIAHTLAFFLIFLNLPNASPLGQTEDFSYIFPPSAGVAMLCAFLLGFGDSCFNTQIYSILGGLFPEDSAPAFALFRFTQSGAAAVSFFYSSSLSLRIQLGILQIFCVIGSYTFFIVEWEDARKRRDLEFESLIHNSPEHHEGSGIGAEHDDFPDNNSDFNP